jgi:quercetin dioxygenase-like cupin family protein
MRIRPCLVVVVVAALLGMQGVAQPQSETAASTLLATAHLDSVVAMPVYFRLYRARVPAAQHASYRGTGAMLYELSGASMIEIEGGEARPLVEGTGTFVAAGQKATISASASAPSDLLLFVLSALPNQWPPIDRPAAVKELYRTPDPLPDLRAGPYEFSLARLTFPAGMPANPPHYRTGAALDYVLAGIGALTADGKTEAMPTETPLVERFGWVHSLANPGDMPLVLLQANISREGDPAVHPVDGK